MIIIKANTGDDEVLTGITKKSKAHWGYTSEQLLAWSDQLTITKAYIEANEVYKLVLGEETAGYYAYFNEDENTVMLDNLFILPDLIGKGHGRLLMDDFLLRIKSAHAKKVILEADPNAEAFYSKFGFKTIRLTETSIKNRYLPVMELEIQ